jgi:hypothetical protein
MGLPVLSSLGAAIKGFYSFNYFIFFLKATYKENSNKTKISAFNDIWISPKKKKLLQIILFFYGTVSVQQSHHQPQEAVAEKIVQSAISLLLSPCPL